jgi:hypothetical protein
MKVKLDVNLSIHVIEEYASARLIFTSKDEEYIYFDHHEITCDGIEYGHCFKIIDQDDIKIDYCKIGSTESLTPDWRITLEPKATLIVTIALTDIYQFKKGNKHLVQYSTYNRSNYNEEKFTKIESNIVEMVIK